MTGCIFRAFRKKIIPHPTGFPSKAIDIDREPPPQIMIAPPRTIPTPHTPRFLKILALAVAGCFAMASGALAQNTVGYTLQTGNLTATQGNGNNSSTFSGVFNNSGTQLGIYANGSGVSDETAYENITTNGVGGGTLRGLYAGDTFSFSLSFASGNNPYGYAGMYFLDNTTASSYLGATGASNSNELASLEIGSSGDWMINNAGTAVNTTIAASTTVSATIAVTSANTYNMTVNGTTYYDLGFENSPSSTTQIESFGLAAQNDQSNFLASGGNQINTGSITLGASNLNLSNAGLITNGYAANSTSTVSVNSVTKAGTGIEILTFNNTYTGSTTISSGTLQLGNAGATGSIQSTSNVSIASGAGLGFALTNSPTFSNAINLSSASGNSYLTVAAGDSTTLSGAITSSGAEFWANGAGTLAISDNAGSASDSASTVVTGGGVLSVSDFSSSTLGTGGFFVPNGTLQYTGASTSTTRVGPYFLQNTATGVQVTQANATLTLPNDIGQFAGGGLVKSGPGTLALTSATETYTGATVVNAGTLIVSGSLTGSSSVTVNAGGAFELDGSYANGTTDNGAGTLQGNGKTGAITMNGGTINPGLTVANASSTPGTLTAAGAVSLSSTTTFSIRLGLVSGASGDNDQLAEASSLTLNNTPLHLTLGSFMNNPAKIGNSYIIVSGGAGSSTGSGTDLFTYNGTALTNNSLFTTSSGYSFTISYDAGGNNDVTLALTAIPEPGTWAMVLSGTGTLLVFQRARRRSKL